MEVAPIESSLAGSETSDTKPSVTQCESETKNLKDKINHLQKKNFGYRNKIKILQQKKRRMTKKVGKLSNIIDSLRNKELIDNEYCTFLSGISETSASLFKRQKKKAIGDKLHMFDQRVKAFAITLHFLSPAAYSFVRKTFDTCLPHPRTLSRWYRSVDANPGFCVEAFKVLESYTGNKLCALMVDGMAIRKHLEWDGYKFHGAVNVGVNNVDDSAPLATEAIFYLVFINSSWKCPVGYFFVNGIKGEQLCALTLQCLTLLHESNVTVTSLTADGAAANIALASKLGCDFNVNNMITHFSHPVTKEPVYFYLDPCHMLKLIRNTLGDKRILCNESGELIEWKYVEMLNELQQREGMHLANKIRNSHVNYEKQKMKVKLAAQVLSQSVSDALLYCCSHQIEGFQGCKATAEFISMFNKLFDILNSRSIRGQDFKKALNLNNVDNVKHFLTNARHYIIQLREGLNGKRICQSQRKTGFLGFLVCIESTMAMYERYVGDSSSKFPLKYIPMYKVSQDHLERLFAYIRSQGGHNNNPSARQFTAAIKKILVSSELQESTKGNALPLDKISILTNQHLSPEHLINVSLPKARLLVDENEMVSESCTQHYLNDHDYVVLPGVNNYSEMTWDICEYIAGFVVRDLEKRIMCTECANILTDTNARPESLISVKDRGGLIKPSRDVLKICKFCEVAFRQKFVNATVVPSLIGSSCLVKNMINSVYQECIGIDVFQNVINHFIEQDAENSHFLWLIEAISTKYINIRIHHYTKLHNDQVHPTLIRQHYTKLVLFSGQ